MLWFWLLFVLLLCCYFQFQLQKHARRRDWVVQKPQFPTLMCFQAMSSKTVAAESSYTRRKSSQSRWSMTQETADAHVMVACPCEAKRRWHDLATNVTRRQIMHGSWVNVRKSRTTHPFPVNHSKTSYSRYPIRIVEFMLSSFLAVMDLHTTCCCSNEVDTMVRKETKKKRLLLWSMHAPALLLAVRSITPTLASCFDFHTGFPDWDQFLRKA